MPEWFELYIGPESAATRLRTYESELIPGLLQTAAYTTEVFRASDPDLPAADIERGVAVRLGRQALLTRRLPKAPPLEIILHGNILAGGPFTILEFASTGRTAEPSIVYSEGLTGALYLDKPKEVEAYDAVRHSIRSISLEEPASRALVLALVKEHEQP